MPSFASILVFLGERSPTGPSERVLKDNCLSFPRDNQPLDARSLARLDARPFIASSAAFRSQLLVITLLLIHLHRFRDRHLKSRFLVYSNIAVAHQEQLQFVLARCGHCKLQFDL